MFNPRTGMYQSIDENVNKATNRVQEVITLTPTSFVLRFDRNDMEFIPGQFLNLGIPGQMDMREYSIFSGIDDDYLEVLIKEVEGGMISNQLKYLQEGDFVSVEGPFGHFSIKPEHKGRKFLFVATGTGISPFHSMIKSYPDLDYQLLHGIRNLEDAYALEAIEPARMVRCVSREEKGDFHGRVTDYLKENPAIMHSLCFMCGNNDMAYDVQDILLEQWIPRANIFAEIYF